MRMQQTKHLFTERWNWVARVSLVLALLAVAVPKGWAADGVESDSVSQRMNGNDRKRFQYFYLEGLRQQEKEHYAAAFDLYRHALGINPSASEVYFELAGCYFDLKQPDKALACYEEAARLDPKNDDYLERLGQMLINQQDYPRAIDAYERLYTTNKSRTDILQVLYQLYAQDGEYDQMLSVLDRMELIEGGNTQIALSRMQIYDVQGEKQKSKGVLLGLVEKNPYDSNYKLMLGNWLLQNDYPKEAYKICQGVLADEPRNVLARMLMLDYYDAAGRQDKRDVLLHQLLRDKETPSESRLALLRQTISQIGKTADSVKVMSFIDDALVAPQEDGEVYMLKAGWMALHNYPTDSLNAVYRAILAVEPENVAARFYLLQNLAEVNDYDGIIAVSKPAQQYSPDEMMFYYFQGFAEYQKHDNDAALETFRKGVAQINDDSNEELVSDLYGLMGEIYHEKGLYKECYAAYDSCLHWKEDNIGALNNYAYYLVIGGGTDLQKAERMSFKTVQAEPQNATFLDTYAWILFKEGRYDDAKNAIERALQSDSTLSIVVLEHCGDIFYMAGDHDRAVEMWKKAAEKDGGNALLRRKIELRKYIEQ